MTFNPLKRRKLSSAKIGNGPLACPSRTQCTIIDVSGRAVTFNPRTGRTRSSGVVLAGGAQALSCPSVRECTAVTSISDNHTGRIGEEVTFNPRSPTSQTPTPIDDAEHDDHSLDCPTVSECVAVTADELTVTFDPISRRVSQPYMPWPNGGEGFATAVACPSDSQCTATDDFGTITTFDPRTHRIIGAHSFPPRSAQSNLSCPSLTQCTSVSNAGTSQRATAVSFRPKSGHVVARTSIARAGYVLALSCSSVARCVAIDDAGRVFAGQQGR